MRSPGSMLSTNRARLGVLGLVQPFVLAAVFLRKLFAPGYLLHSDFITPLSFTPTFFSRFLYAWDPVTGGFSYNAPKLSLQLVTAVLVGAGLSTALVYKLFVVFILGLAGATMFRLLYRRIGRSVHPSRAYAAATVGSLVFTINPWVMDKLHHHFWLVLGYALLPVIYVLYRRALDGRASLSLVLSLSLLFTVEATQPHSLFVFVVPLLGVTAAVHLIVEPTGARLVDVVRTSALIGAVALLVNMFWILPLAVFYANASPAPAGYLLTVENIEVLSRHSSMLRASQLRSGFGMGGFIRGGFGISYVTGTEALDQTWPAVGLLVLAFALVALVVDRVDCPRDRLAFAAVLVGSLVLLTGTKPPFGDVYRWAGVSLPAGWLIRDPFKFGGLFAFATAGLVGLSTADVLEEMGTVRIVERPALADGASAVVVAVLVLATAIHGWPIVTGDLNEHFEPATVPDRYDRTFDWLDENARDARILWLPYQHISVDDPTVIKYRWTRGIAKYHVRGTKFLEFSTPGTVMAQSPQNREFLMWFHQGLRDGTLRDPSGHLRGVGVGYVVFQLDLPANTRAPEIYDRLTADPGITEVYRDGPLRVLRVRDASLVRASPVVGTDGFGQLDAWADRPGPVDGAAVTFDPEAPNRDGLLLSGDAAQRYVPGSQVIAPMGATDYHRPALRWSKARVDDPFQGQWHKYLAEGGVTNWQTDYGRGMAFTWRPVEVPGDVTPPPADRLARWTFDDGTLPDGWAGSGRDQTVSVDDGALAVELTASDYGWKRVTMPRLPADLDRVYRLTFEVRGRNVHGAHVKVSEYGEDGTLLGVNRAGLVGNGSFDGEVSVDYVPRNANASELRFEIWHGHETEQPLPNRLWIDDVRVYDVTRYAEFADLRTTVTVDEAGEYRLDGRYFANPDGGRIRVSIDGRPADVDTQASFDTFVWGHVMTRRLEAGEHTVVIENVHGFNAVNLLTLTPTATFDRRQRDLSQSLRNATVTYLFEAEQDLRTTRAESVSWATPDGGRDRGSFLAPGGRAWRTVDVITPGWYDLSVRGSGVAVVRVDDRRYLLDRDGQGTENLGRVYLSRGRHPVSIEPVPSPIDVTGFESEGQWSGGDPAFDVERSMLADNGTGSLRVETNRTDRRWSWVYTEPVAVTTDAFYGVSASIRTSNANQSHVVVQGYDREDGVWRRLAVLGAGTTEYSDWTTFRKTIGIPANVTDVRFALNGGWTADPESGPGRTWFDDLQVETSAPHSIDHLRLERGPADSTEEAAVSTGDSPASVTGYERISPTRYRVQVDATAPYLLSFAQDFDPQWVAEVETPEGTERIHPTEVYGAINGFPIDRTGEYTVTIRYRPQRWLVYGGAISGVTLFACFGALAFRWRRRRGDTWTRWIDQRAHLRPRDARRRARWWDRR